MPNKKPIATTPDCDAFILQTRGSNVALFNADKMTLTPAEFQRQLQRAYTAGREAAESEKSIFEQIFG